MTTLEQEIADLKEEIKGYKTEFEAASTEDKILLLHTINSRTETLNHLLEEKKAQYGGSFGSIRFEDLLSRGFSDFSPNVVARARRRFSAQMVLAITLRDVDSAIEVYEQALALPQTVTEMKLNIEGYELSVPCEAGDGNIICHKDTAPHVLKALTPREITRVSSLLIVLKEQNHMNPYLTSFELFTHEKKSFMIMPYYPSTLVNVRKISVNSGIRLFNQVRSAVDYLHSLNYNHMDIKPSNICLRDNGDIVLVDLGSVVMKLEMSESTVAYVPSDFQPRHKRFPTNQYKAVDVNDWLMLGMSIAEKVYGLEVGRRAPPPTVAGLTTILETDGAFGELIALFQQV